MEHISKPTERIINISPKNSDASTTIAANIRYFATDFAKLCMNIKATSIGEADRLERCQRLSIDSGIDYVTIKNLTN